jgi:hypothetical protein
VGKDRHANDEGCIMATLTTPQAITLISSSVAASTYAEYAAATTYALGDKVKVTDATTGYECEYESMQGSNTGHDPTSDDGTWWHYLGYSNRFRMFDPFVNTTTTDISAIEVNISGESYIDTICLFGLTGAKEVHIVIMSGTDTVHDEIYLLDETIITDAYEYCFAPFEFRDRLLAVSKIAGLYLGMEITITITGEVGTTVGCGMVKVGRSTYIGHTKWGVDLGIEDYSVKDVNEFGERYLLERDYEETVSATLRISTGDVDAVTHRLSSARATGCVWNLNNRDISAPTNYEALIKYGFCEDFGIIPAGRTNTEIRLEIQGLV